MRAISISLKPLQAYIDVGYSYLLMPDHVPLAANDPGGLQSFAYCYGYICALLQAAGHMACSARCLEFAEWLTTPAGARLVALLGRDLKPADF